MPFTAQQQKNLEDLSPRCWGVFREVVRQYIFDGCPVGSETIAEVYHENLSSASIRKVMARLEEVGLIFQPHVSAGRVPTDLGYRCYVDRFVRTGDLKPEDRHVVSSQLQGSPETGRLLDAAARLLSALSHQVGVVVAPYLRRMTLRNIEFVRISRTRMLAVFVSESGSVVNRVVEMDQTPSQEELERFARLLVDEFQGKTLPTMREILAARLSRESAAWDRLARSAMRLGLSALGDEEGEEEPTEVFVGGKANILSLPDAVDLTKMRNMLHALEQKEKIVHLLDRCLTQDGVGALIGTESGEEDLTDLAVVAASYQFRGRPLGALGIIGPTRMEYDRNLALVSHIAETIGHILTEESE